MKLQTVGQYRPHDYYNNKFHYTVTVQKNSLIFTLISANIVIAVVLAISVTIAIYMIIIIVVVIVTLVIIVVVIIFISPPIYGRHLASGDRCALKNRFKNILNDILV